jgi:glycosyltransferase involved in cell wall biosynthesis
LSKNWPAFDIGRVMRIAFYAPLKPPDHPVPSGDRRVAQLLFAALQLAGHAPVTAARLRSYDGRGDPLRQARLAALGRRIGERIIRRSQAAPAAAPELWFTYHLYHKAPDWLGPDVAGALAIPYVIVEASFAPKRARGAWAAGHRAVERALCAADLVIGLNPADRDCVLPLLSDPTRWLSFKPFLDADAYAASVKAVGPPRLITVAMMRHGDKLASYRVLGEALSRLLDLDWSLEVVGDGMARRDVERALAPIARRVVWSGVLEAAAVAERLAAADLCVWPAINEAFGMALLEAQASGLPVVAGAGGGVGAVVVPQETGLLVAPGDAAAFAEAVRSLIVDRDRRVRFAAAARRQALAEHGLAAAARRLGEAVGRFEPRRAA